MSNSGLFRDGEINSKKIKDMFEVFGDKTSLEEIHSLKKLLRCSQIYWMFR